MQVFLYSLLYEDLPDRVGNAIQPSIYYLRSIFGDDFDPSVYHNPARGQRNAVNDFSDYSNDYETALRNCLDSIFAADVPFVQTSVEKSCSYCSFKSICGK
jgi:hypothetical protein